MMKEQLISFVTAKLAHKKGFDLPTDWKCRKLDGEQWHRYRHRSIFNMIQNTLIPLPTQSLLQKWLREEHEIHVNCEFAFHTPKTETAFIGVVRGMNKKASSSQDGYINFKISNKYKSVFYEEALEKALQEALKKVK